jgi:hypothetical protein
MLQSRKSLATFKAEVISYGKSPNAEALLVNFIKFLLFKLKKLH